MSTTPSAQPTPTAAQDEPIAVETLADRVRYWRNACDLSTRAALIIALWANFPLPSGKGNRAAKRAAMIEVAREQAEWFDAQAALTDEDAERMAAEYAERRGEARLLSANVSFHD